MSVTVREATLDDRLGVRRALDAAMLEVRDDLRERTESGDVLVASENDAGLILGALVLVPYDGGERPTSDANSVRARVDAIAVRRARRDRGIGSAMVQAAAERYPRLTAEFDPDVRPFYESLGFEVETVAGSDDRLRGRYGKRRPDR